MVLLLRLLVLNDNAMFATAGSGLYCGVVLILRWLQSQTPVLAMKLIKSTF